jgi:hypothetical protein
MADYNTVLENLRKIEQSFLSENIEKILEQCRALTAYSVNVVEKYDPDYATNLCGIEHSFKIFYAKLDVNETLFYRDYALEMIDKSHSLIEIAHVESEYEPIYEPIAIALKKTRNLLLQEKWPDKKFTVTTALLLYLKEHNNQFSKKIISSVNDAIKKFDSYFDYLDPSYRTE